MLLVIIPEFHLFSWFLGEGNFAFQTYKISVKSSKTFIKTKTRLNPLLNPICPRIPLISLIFA
jgi:hypothetical protein